MKVNPKQADTLAELAVANLVQKRYKEAEELFQKAYQADPSNVRGLLGMARVRLVQNDPDGAVRVITDEIKKQPQRADLKRELPDIELQVRHYDKAIEDYQSILDHYKNAPIEQAEIYGRIGQAYDLKGDLQHGVDNYQKARQLVPSNIFYVRRLADLLAGRANRRKRWRFTGTP